MGESTKQTPEPKRRQTRHERTKQRNEDKLAPELKPFKSYEASTHCSDVLVESHAQFWADTANDFLDKGHTREEAATLATEDFLDGMDELKQRAAVADRAQQIRLKEEADTFRKNAEALQQTQTGGGRRRRGQQEGANALEAQTEARNKLADQLTRSQSGRRRRAGLDEKEESRLVREAEAHIAYQKEHLSRPR